MREKQPPDTNLPPPSDNNQSRTLGMPLKSSDFDHLDKTNQFVEMASNPCGSSRKDG